MDKRNILVMRCDTDIGEINNAVATILQHVELTNEAIGCDSE